MLFQLQCFCIVWIFYCMMKKNDCKSLKMLNFSFKYFTRKTLLRYIFFSWVPWWASRKGDAMYIELQSRAFKFHKTIRRLSVISGTLTSYLVVTSQAKVLFPPCRQKKMTVQKPKAICSKGIREWMIMSHGFCLCPQEGLIYNTAPGC